MGQGSRTCERIDESMPALTESYAFAELYAACSVALCSMMYSMLVDLRCVLCRKWCCQVDVKSFAEYKYDGGEYRLMPAFTVITSLLEALDFFGRITSII